MNIVRYKKKDLKYMNIVGDRINLRRKRGKEGGKLKVSYLLLLIRVLTSSARRA